MDRYVIKERRSGAEYPQGNQMIAFSASSPIGNNITIPLNSSFETLYYGPGELPVQRAAAGFVNVNMNTPRFVPNMVQNPGQIVSGIDPCYLAAYSSDNMASFSGPAQQMHQEQNKLPGNVPFGSNYQHHNFYPVEKVTTKTMPQPYPQGAPVENLRLETQAYSNRGNNRNVSELESPQQSTAKISEPTTRKQSEVNLLKNEAQYQVRTRSEKLKALHKSGPRAFSGPVEKVLKWHKSLQDIGLLVFYEIVAKCVSVRPGERCAKNIVVRDDSGPAMQVVYYEVDFFLPELKPPCTIRVIGRMMPGTCRLQAFNVRIASGDDVSTLPRRAAVAAHHVAKLCKEYGKDT